MADEYQNKTGLSYFYGRIKNIFATKTDVATDLAGKVDKETGKGLSSNDYTGTEKTKLSEIESGAEVNVIDSISVNSTAVSPDANKNVNISVPTDTNQLTNGAGFQNATQVGNAIDAAISGITGITFNFDYDTYSELPATGEAGTIYFIPDQTCFEVTSDTSFQPGKKYFELVSGSYVPTEDTTMQQGKTYYTLKTGVNTYDEYVWSTAKSSYEMFGSASIDVSNLWSKSELTAITTQEIDDIIDPPTP